MEKLREAAPELMKQQQQQQQEAHVSPPLVRLEGGAAEGDGPEGPLALQPPPPPRNKALPLQVPAGGGPHPRLKQRRASDVIDSGSSSPMGSPGALGTLGPVPGSLPREYRVFGYGGSPLPSPGPSPRSPASDRGYGGSTFSSPVTPVRPASARPVRDATDAAVMNDDSNDNNLPGYPEVPVAVMPVEKNSAEYNMRHERRGLAVIFNNDEFQMVGMAPRVGSKVDVENLEKAFTALQFEVQVHRNKMSSEIREIMLQIAEQDHSNADCIAIAVLTHGLSNGFLLANDVPYSVQTLWQPFTADKCLTLAGKPKLFFIQACRGDKLDAGVTLRQRSRTETDSGISSYKIPTHSDFLVAYSAPEGFLSWRNPENGTWFIQCLADELYSNGQKLDILRILTRVSRRVALDYESYSDIVPWEHQCKIVPCFTSMLIRDLIFHPKGVRSAASPQHPSPLISDIDK